MKSFEEIFCECHHCTPLRFRRRVFWRTLHRHALPVAPLFLMGDHFLSDFELIAQSGRAQTMRAIRDECEAHRYHPLSHGWLRDRLDIRVSSHLLQDLAKEYLPGSSKTT